MIKLNENNIEFIGDDINLFKIGDKISIVYNQINNDIYAYIGLNDVLKDEKSYTVTKSHTILFKGENNKFLSTFGCEFDTKLLSNGIYELIPINKPKDLSINNIESYKEEIKIEDEILDVDTFTINFINKL